MTLTDKEFFLQFVSSDAKKKAHGFAFTWNNYTEEDVETLKATTCRYLTFGREVGASGTPHLQGFIYFNNAVSIPGVGRLYPWHAEPIKQPPSTNVIYCGKDAERFERGDRPKDSETKSALEAQLWERAKTAAIEGRFADIPAQMYVRYKRTWHELHTENLPIKKLCVIEEPYPWQAELEERLTGEPDPRKVLWIYDPEGGKGKSEMYSRLVEGGAFPMAMGRYPDMAYSVPLGGARTFVFNLARQKQVSILYNFLEDLKDGSVHSTKYVPVYKRFSRPHVVVFANYEPDYQQMSSDRFEVILI